MTKPVEAGYGTAMEHFLHILSLPDNIPIIFMLLSVVFLTWLSFSEAKKNDKLTDEGKADQIYRRMVE
ncbi:hypothetical protein F9K50_02600 [bacterium]|nr:MAG: hypothetical protein F9K50_02600 [bacterium]